jgi:hypothetical protein
MILHLTYDAISRYVFETIPTRILLPLLTAHQDTSGDNNEDAAGAGIVHVTTTHLIATALPLLLIAAAGRHFDLGIENKGVDGRNCKIFYSAEYTGNYTAANICARDEYGMGSGSL